MGNPYYGLASAASDVYKGYEQEEGRVAEQAKGTQDTEKRKLELDKMRSQANTEQSKEAISKILQGDMEGATELLGQFGMEDLEFDSETKLVSWTKDGEDHAVLLPHLMTSVGMKPQDLDTSEEKHGRAKELITHKAQEAKKYGISKGGSKPTAYIQNLEYTMKKLTGGDPNKAFKLMQLSKSDPQAAYSRILVGLQKQNAEAFTDEKMTDEEMRKKAKDSVTSFRDDMFEGLLGGDKQDAAGNKDPLGLL